MTKRTASAATREKLAQAPRSKATAKLSTPVVGVTTRRDVQLGTYTARRAEQLRQGNTTAV